MINKLLSEIIACCSIVLFFISGCAHTQPGDDIQISLKQGRSLKKEEAGRVEEVIKQITERNRTIEDSKEWLASAYSSLKIKKLNNIPRDEYQNYKKFLNKKTVYIIVHPAYYIFFQNTDTLSSKSDAVSFPLENIVERFYKKIPFFDSRMRIFQEQERILRDFLEFMSTEKKLILLILPGGYKKHLSYGYIDGLDEYARYINETTNMSESVIYMESISYYQGDLSENDLSILHSFLQEIGAQTIALGGGYFGRCLGTFYMQIGVAFGFDNIYFVPELTAISPEDLNEPWTNNMLTKDGRLNIRAVSRNLLTPEPYGKHLDMEPRVRNLPFSFYKD